MPPILKVCIHRFGETSDSEVATVGYAVPSRERVVCVAVMVTNDPVGPGPRGGILSPGYVYLADASA